MLVTAGTQVVTVVLLDIHEFVFLYEALQAVCNQQKKGSDRDALITLTTAFHNNYGNAPRCFALTAWLGLGQPPLLSPPSPPPATVELLGAPGERDDMIARGAFT